MPRTARAAVGGVCYHVLNRGNGRAEVFHKPEDYDAFVELLAQACERLPMRVFGWCLMPNHFHLVVRPYADDDLGRWMQWLMTSHVRRYHRHYHSEGHVWQGRFKAFPIQADDHLLTVLRYVERNPLRAGLVERAEAWRWSSLALRTQDPPPKLLATSPVKLPRNWPSLVNRPQTEAEVQAVRKSIERGAPLGRRRLATPHGRQTRPRIHAPPPRKAEKAAAEKVECPLSDLSLSDLRIEPVYSGRLQMANSIDRDTICMDTESKDESAKRLVALAGGMWTRISGQLGGYCDCVDVACPIPAYRNLKKK